MCSLKIFVLETGERRTQLFYPWSAFIACFVSLISYLHFLLTYIKTCEISLNDKATFTAGIALLWIMEHLTLAQWNLLCV
jgi:hypothetical protein